MTTRYQTEPRTKYQREPRTLASRLEVERSLIEAIRIARRSLVEMDTDERRLFDDLQRGRGLGMFVRAIDVIRAKGRCPADQLALADHLRFCLKHGKSLDVTEREAIERETEANHRGDMAQWRHRFAPSMGSRDGLREAMRDQAVWSEIMADVAESGRPALIRVGR
jgi:hypothetical protein